MVRRTRQHALARWGVAVVVAATVGPWRAAAEPASGAGPRIEASTKAGAAAKTEPASDGEPAGAPTPIYVVRAASTDPRLLAALEAARTRLHGQGVELTVANTRPDETAAGRARALVVDEQARGAFWFDDRTPGELRVFMIAADGSAWVRRVPVDPQTPEATREAVWLIVESSSLALAAGEQVAMEQAEAALVEAEPSPKPAEADASATSEPAPAPKPKATPTPAPARRTRVRLGLAYLGDGLARAVPWQSGVGIDGMLDLGARWRLGLGYGLLAPWRRGDPPVTWRHRVELRAGVRGMVAPRVELSALAGGALEAVRWHAREGDGGGVRMLGAATLDGGLGVRLVADLWLVMEAGAGVLGNRFDFIECAAGATRCDGMLQRVVLAPWRIQPRTRIGLAMRF